MEVKDEEERMRRESQKEDVWLGKEASENSLHLEAAAKRDLKTDKTETLLRA